MFTYTYKIGEGLYSGIFNPPSDGRYNFSAEFTVDTDSVCTGYLCVPSDFFASATGRCQIQVQGKGIDPTTDPTETTGNIKLNKHWI